MGFALKLAKCYNQSEFYKEAGVTIKYKLADKRDIILGAVILISALIIYIVFWLVPFEGQLYACIYIDGEFVESIPLETELNEVEIKTQYGINSLIILDNKAYIDYTDCGYEQCADKGAISRPAQCIVCAPHGLLITIEDAKSIEER